MYVEEFKVRLTIEREVEIPVKGATPEEAFGKMRLMSLADLRPLLDSGSVRVTARSVQRAKRESDRHALAADDFWTLGGAFGEGLTVKAMGAEEIATFVSAVQGLRAEWVSAGTEAAADVAGLDADVRAGREFAMGSTRRYRWAVSEFDRVVGPVLARAAGLTQDDDGVRGAALGIVAVLIGLRSNLSFRREDLEGSERPERQGELEAVKATLRGLNQVLKGALEDSQGSARGRDLA